MRRRRITKRILMVIFSGVVLAGMSVSTASAQLAGHNVIMIHGFAPDDLIFNPSDEEIYARRIHSDFWQNNSEGFLNWSAAERVEGHISEQLVEQAKGYSEEGLCDNGCVLVTISTGDQVARHFMANQEIWLESEGYEPLNIIATLDFVGAGGGTDIADIAVAASTSEYIPEWMKIPVGMVLGLDLDFTDYDELGVVHDLTYNGARNISMEPNDIPRLRFSGGGNSGIGAVNPMSQMIQGEDDTLIPASSTCGASSPAGIDSCSNYVGYDGKRGNYNGPDGLLYNHFPVLMADAYDHYNLASNDHKGKATYVYNNFNATLNVDFETYTEEVTKRWWQFWIEAGTWQYVKDSDTKSVVKLAYDTLNN